MGVDIVIYSENNIFENNIDFTIDKLCNIFNKKLHIYGEFNRWGSIKNDEYFNVNIGKSKTLNEYFEKDKNIFLATNKLQFHMNENSIFYYSYNWDISVWSNIVNYLLAEFNEKLMNYYKEKINKIKYCSKIFDSRKLIIFNDTDHQDIEDKMDEGLTIDEVIKDKRWKIFTKPCNKNACNEDDELWNYIYYETWENNNDFNLNTWLNEYL